MKLKPYKEVLRMTKEGLDESLVDVRVNRVKKQAELEVALLEEQVADRQVRINELCAERELRFDSIITAQNELSLLERKRKQFAQILSEMFPAGE